MANSLISTGLLQIPFLFQVLQVNGHLVNKEYNIRSGQVKGISRGASGAQGIGMKGLLRSTRCPRIRNQNLPSC